ncbi:MAG TPA: dihydropteroate synthase [Flavobacteriales bacterium]|nr:dihydropteroate synthase [Flavobacteriales bacterium]HQW40761.1 dihydropteroate synthase [Flavobacteriales bacterium]
MALVPDVTWRIGDQLIVRNQPMVMGILNVTPDSFHVESRTDLNGVLHVAERMLMEGATILDIGGASSRPGATEPGPEEELRRVLPVIDAIIRRFPDALLSVDTYHAKMAKEAVETGAGMVNDIGAGMMDPDMFRTVSLLKVPYVLMHMQGTPRTMQRDPHYTDVASEVTLFLSTRMKAAHDAGIPDVIIDPGFGFGKTTEHNFTLLNSIPRLVALGAPVMVGLSRKRMINEVLGTTSAHALNGTSVLHTLALNNGAAILRVHDVKEAVECVKLIQAYANM